MSAEDRLRRARAELEQAKRELHSPKQTVPKETKATEQSPNRASEHAIRAHETYASKPTVRKPADDSPSLVSLFNGLGILFSLLIVFAPLIVGGVTKSVIFAFAAAGYCFGVALTCFFCASVVSSLAMIERNTRG